MQLLISTRLKLIQFTKHWCLGPQVLMHSVFCHDPNECNFYVQYDAQYLISRSCTHPALWSVRVGVIKLAVAARGQRSSQPCEGVAVATHPILSPHFQTEGNPNEIFGDMVNALLNDYLTKIKISKTKQKKIKHINQNRITNYVIWEGKLKTRVHLNFFIDFVKDEFNIVYIFYYRLLKSIDLKLDPS